eukprot:gene40924-54188_t
MFLPSLPAHAEMRGHGGPVKAIAIAPDGKTAVTGSFDTTVIVWDLETETAKQVLRFHEAPVNHVQMPRDGVFITASDDGRIALWETGKSVPDSVIHQTKSPVVSSSLAFQGNTSFLSAAYADRTIMQMQGRAPVLTETLREQPLALVHLPTGETLLALANASLRWMATGKTITLPANANTLAAAPDGEIIAGGADGNLTIL